MPPIRWARVAFYATVIVVCLVVLALTGCAEVDDPPRTSQARTVEMVASGGYVFACVTERGSIVDGSCQMIVEP